MLTTDASEAQELSPAEIVLKTSSGFWWKKLPKILRLECGNGLISVQNIF